jgi:hypothetical protein
LPILKAKGVWLRDIADSEGFAYIRCGDAVRFPPGISHIRRRQSAAGRVKAYTGKANRGEEADHGLS